MRGVKSYFFYFNEDIRIFSVSSSRGNISPGREVLAGVTGGVVARKRRRDGRNKEHSGGHTEAGSSEIVVEPAGEDGNGWDRGRNRTNWVSQGGGRGVVLNSCHRSRVAEMIWADGGR